MRSACCGVKRYTLHNTFFRILGGMRLHCSALTLPELEIEEYTWAADQGTFYDGYRLGSAEVNGNALSNADLTELYWEMDRSAIGALDVMANGGKTKYGAAVMVGGADPKWLSLQRTLPGEFLKLYNCHTVGMFTIGDTGLKGEILLKPSVMRKVHELGESVVTSLETEVLHQYTYSELEGRLICPVCFSDTFHVDKNGHYTCAICNNDEQKSILGKLQCRASDAGKRIIFSSDGAKEHNDFIGNKISQFMQATDEVQHRLKQYFEHDIVPSQDYTIDTGEENTGEIAWDEEGFDAFNHMVPGAFKSFVKKAVEKKAHKKGIALITKDVFLQIKRESGNLGQ